MVVILVPGVSYAKWGRPATSFWPRRARHFLESRLLKPPGPPRRCPVVSGNGYRICWGSVIFPPLFIVLSIPALPIKNHRRTKNIFSSLCFPLWITPSGKDFLWCVGFQVSNYSCQIEPGEFLEILLQFPKCNLFWWYGVHCFFYLIVEVSVDGGNLQGDNKIFPSSYHFSGSYLERILIFVYPTNQCDFLSGVNTQGWICKIWQHAKNSFTGNLFPNFIRPPKLADWKFCILFVVQRLFPNLYWVTRMVSVLFFF